ncbi:mycothiol system anti-sigma-R factor [Georgenia satyanarayanai]|uniref:Mycothiol system anti-sigma-R factor n=1 Tax=Georgenia satyanarayanai TaxID=860221 RepID=A0A2Y9AG15_9MICO|nr:mycothiol system anti-sigma-R factor [Georgenia satyanarayanai]PYF99333.1 mycothiol system anti-sigma-R factor [Georgenia satyanarayanai]SSA43145.1 mycothiol system anti-sigma-R factor [Georgenia satyanarayanai]
MTDHTDPLQDIEACRCEELLEHLFEFVDSEMDDHDRERLRRHLDECPTCREATDAEARVRLLLRRSCQEVAPSTLRLRVITQISVLRSGGSPG